MSEKFGLNCKEQDPLCKVNITTENVDRHISLEHISLSFDSIVSPRKTVFIFSFSCIDAFSIWRPNKGAVRNVSPNWRKHGLESRLASGVPAMSVISKKGNNRVTIALSDAQTPCSIACGISEETAEIEFKLELFTQPVSPLNHYDITVRIDRRDIPFYDSLADVEKWWRTSIGFSQAYVPDAAKMPMDSLWYSFHQMLDPKAIIEECIASKTLGMDTVIIDDGWQTDDNNRGYEYCGDWEVTPSKISDMKALVDELHKIGMKVILWFSVPFVGIHSHRFAEFEGMYLGSASRKNNNVMILDPRYKKVREYLVDTYVNAVRNYGLDGLKLDFIDSFSLTEMSIGKTFDGKIVSLEDGVEALLKDVYESLRSIDPEIMIEFRQNYVGPTIRKYGNILRVADCPGDAQSNRTGVIDLRLISGNTAVHSDMIMWHSDERNQAAAAQLLAVMFGVPQVSLRIPTLKEDHKRLLKYFLSYWRENRDVLLDGKLTVNDPDVCYSLVSSQKDGKKIAVRYLPVPFDVADCECCRLFNATEDERVTVFVDDKEEYVYAVFDCLGNEMERGSFSNTRIMAFDVPASGNVELYYLK